MGCVEKRGKVESGVSNESEHLSSYLSQSNLALPRNVDYEVNDYSIYSHPIR
jgi:hypothetical protein